MRLSVLRFSLLAAACMTPAFTSPALAAWPHSPASPLLLTSFVKNNMVVDAAVPDGSGGAYVFWEGDNGADKNIFGNHVLGDGTLDPAWPATPGVGVTICNAAGDQTAVQAQLDGNGGIWLCWNDNRTGTPHNFVTRLLTNGTLSPAFPANGLQLGSARTNNSHPPQIAGDGGTGLLVVWEYETTPTNHDIVGSHVSASGLEDWSVALSADPATDVSPALLGGSGVFQVVWLRNPTTAMFGVFSEANGSQVGGTVALSTNASMLEPPRICADGMGGQFAAWVQTTAVPQYSLAAARLYSGSISENLGAQSYGPVIVSILDLRYVGGLTACAVVGIPSAGSISAFPITRFGYAGYTPVTTITDLGYRTVSTDNGDGSVIMASPDFMNGVAFVGTSRRTIANGVGFPPGFWVNDADGLPTTLLPTAAVPGAICSDGDGGALVFSNQLNASINSAYVIRMDRWGALDGAAHITSVKDVPGDQGGHVRLTWSASYLDVPGGSIVGNYYIWRQAPAAVAQASLSAGARAYESARAARRAPAPGSVRIAQRFGQTYAWELITTQPAVGFANYSITVPTVADSSAAGPANTVYMVEAFWPTQNAGWPSPPDSGHSVDNLPPATPSLFTAALLAGGTSTELTWAANTEPDLAGYQLYRGATSGFVPGPGNLIALPTGTSFLDPTVGQFYKLAAVDTHGNLSPFALAVPAGSLDAPGEGVPRELALALASANPSASGATLRYALPKTGAMRLELYDLHGRIVRELFAGTQAAGSYTARWDGRDASGAPAPSGIYFVRLDAPGGRLVRRIALSH